MDYLYSSLTRSNKCFAFLLSSFLAVFAFSSCISSKPVKYFNGTIDTSQLQNIVIPEQRIKTGDILNIVIYSDNPEATAIFNQASGGSGNASPMGGKGNATTSGSSSGYLVDDSGSIRLHAIGLLKVEGLTRKQLEELITQKLLQLGVLTNPYCVIRNSNFKIILLGEVGAPGVYTFPTEKASVLEAIGMAGDITIYGKKDDILLVRENQGKRTYANINLTDPNVFTSPYFYLQQNDILVVQPDKRKPTVSDQLAIQLVTLSFSLVSTIAILITIFK